MTPGPKTLNTDTTSLPKIPRLLIIMQNMAATAARASLRPAAQLQPFRPA